MDYLHTGSDNINLNLNNNSSSEMNRERVMNKFGRDLADIRQEVVRSLGTVNNVRNENIRHCVNIRHFFVWHM